MGRIRPDVKEMKIEHWRCQTRYPNERLSYRNLLGACLGNEGQPPSFQHCDTKKGDADLLWNPADPAHAIEARVQYDSECTISSNDATFDTQLNRILNLNLAFLKNNRKGVLDAVLCWWRGQPRPVLQGRIERQRDKYAAGSGELAPYCQVAVWWLQRKLQGMPR